MATEITYKCADCGKDFISHRVRMGMLLCKTCVEARRKKGQGPVQLAKAGEIKSAAEATEIARNFIKKYRVIASPLRAVREGDAWFVEIDVGPLFKLIAKVKIDAKSGEVLEYTIP